MPQAAAFRARCADPTGCEAVAAESTMCALVTVRAAPATAKPSKTVHPAIQPSQPSPPHLPAAPTPLPCIFRSRSWSPKPLRGAPWCPGTAGRLPGAAASMHPQPRARCWGGRRQTVGTLRGRQAGKRGGKRGATVNNLVAHCWAGGRADGGSGPQAGIGAFRCAGKNADAD